MWFARLFAFKMRLSVGDRQNGVGEGIFYAIVHLEVTLEQLGRTCKLVTADLIDRYG